MNAQVVELGIQVSRCGTDCPGTEGSAVHRGDDGRIRRWDVETGEPVGDPFGDHAGAVRAMASGAPIDGRPMLVTGGDDGAVRRWDNSFRFFMQKSGVVWMAIRAGHGVERTQSRHTGQRPA
jgi:WD40 repeat protein